VQTKVPETSNKPGVKQRLDRMIWTITGGKLKDIIYISKSVKMELDTGGSVISKQQWESM